MSHVISNRLRNSSASLALTVATLFFAGPAFAQQVAANDPSTGQPLETVVVTGTAQFNTDAAPAKSSLTTVEPETIINKTYIENFMPPQADYVTILAIVPGMTGGDPNGPGLSDGGAKNTLRGFADGNFAMQYDDIPFGDTNGPTHHNISYFPASTIGSINVDRGPGNAGNLGANTFGGTIKLFSETLGDDLAAKGFVSYGSFGTWIANANAQSGDVEIAGTQAKGLINVQHLESQGALSFQNLGSSNLELKVQDTFAPNWTVTLYGSYSYLKEHLDDNNGLTPAQVLIFGKDFALQNTNPTLPTYQAYNYTTKATDFDYVRLTGQIASGLIIDNTGYTYAYWNHTFSPNSQTQTLPQIQANTSGDTLTLNKATDVSGVNQPSDLLAYDKQNAYRVWGDVVRVSQDYDLGGVTGQVRAGIWYEGQATHRYKYYFDANQCAADKSAVYLQNSPSAASAVCGAKKGSDLVAGLGYSKDDEYSAWTQYQPFAEIDIRPTEDLLITPGVKYIHWNHSVNAPVEQGNTCGVDMACAPYNALGQDFVAAFTTTDTLPFLTANYRLDTNWSVYAEYAKGVYVPDISSFEASTQTTAFPKPENTTNYQLGTVYYADRFTFDADIYYIPIANFYTSLACPAPNTGDTCFVNNGRATYSGIEGEGTYAFDNLMGLDVTGLSMFANGALMRSKAQTGLWEPAAPFWTAALGILYQNSGWRFSIIDKYTGQQYSDATNTKSYELGAYGDFSASIAYDFANYEIGVNADNLFNSRAATLITEGGTGTGVATSTDQYFFQAPMSVMVTLKAHL
jgi:iron complex outermembrane receptor protein